MHLRDNLNYTLQDQQHKASTVMWKDLSMSEKSDIIRLGVRNGISNLNIIRDIYDRNTSKDDLLLEKSIVGLEEVNNKELNEEPNNTSNVFAKGGMMSVANRAKQYFISKGMSDVAATGLVANLMRESSLNPNAINGSSGAYGLAQWLGSRKRALFNKYGNRPSFDNQLEFIWSELNSSHKNGLRMLQSSKNIDEAAMNAFGYYEFSAGPKAAVAAMNKSGQAGNAALNKGVNFARQIAGGKLKGNANYDLSGPSRDNGEFSFLRYQEPSSSRYQEQQMPLVTPLHIDLDDTVYKPVNINIPSFNNTNEDLVQMGLGIPQVVFKSKVPEMIMPNFLTFE